MSNIERMLYGRIAHKKAAGPVQGAIIRKGLAKHGKKVVYVTPVAFSAREEAKKYEEKGFRAEIKRELEPDSNKMVYVVYIFE